METSLPSRVDLFILRCCFGYGVLYVGMDVRSAGSSAALRGPKTADEINQPRLGQADNILFSFFFQRFFFFEVHALKILLVLCGPLVGTV